MEAVLKVRFPGIVMPWREMRRGCLVILLLGILYLCVQNCAKRNEAVKPAAACSEAEHRIVSVIRKAEPSEICENMRPIAADIRKGLASAGPALTWNISGMVSALEMADSKEIPVFDHFVVPEDNTIPEGFVDPGESVIPEGFVDPGESMIPEGFVDSGESVAPGESMIPEGTVDPGESVIPEKIAGFVLDEEGYVTGCTEQIVVRDGLLFIPDSDSCVGIRSGALDELGEFVTEVYLPANISDIGPGTFDAFPYLMFVEVSGDNPYYYSLDGILYSASGEEIFYPAGRTIE